MSDLDKINMVYSWFWDKAREMERELPKIPESPTDQIIGSGIYPQRMIQSALCIIKEVTKWAKSCDLETLAQTPHYDEEVRLLQREMDLLIEDIRRAKLRGNWKEA